MKGSKIISQIRASRRISQQTLAEKAKISRSTVATIEGGTHQARGETAYKLIKALDQVGSLSDDECGLLVKSGLSGGLIERIRMENAKATSATASHTSPADVSTAARYFEQLVSTVGSQRAAAMLRGMLVAESSRDPIPMVKLTGEPFRAGDGNMYRIIRAEPVDHPQAGHNREIPKRRTS